MTGGIYGVFGIENQCLYIGLSRNIETRWVNHKKLIKNGCHPQKGLVEWSKQHGGAEQLTFRILEVLPENSSDVNFNKAEIVWFNQLNPLFFGKVPSTKETWRQSQETKQKISESVRRFNRIKGSSIEEKICVGCETKFLPSRNKITFCSNSCGLLTRSKIKPEDVAEIVLLSRTMTQRQLASKFEVNQPTIFRVLKYPEVYSRGKYVTTQQLNRTHAAIA